MSDIILSEQQKAVVNWENGNCVVCATAGSGKTRCVVSRIARMVKEGIDPHDILATTFTVKAAGEMNERLAMLGCPIRAGDGGSGARVGTYHSLCLEIIRDGSPWSDYVVDDKDKMRMELKKILGYQQMNWKHADLTMVQNFIAHCKNELVAPDEAKHHDRRYVDAYRRYEKQRHELRVLTFDDMLFSAVAWLQEDRESHDRWAYKHRHVIVDEFQDSNLAQYVLGTILTKGAKSWMVVGDDDQCQPPDTMVQVKSSKYGVEEVPISSLEVGQEVRVFNRKSGRVVGTRKVLDKHIRWYEGDMVRISASGLHTRATPNHKFLARWTDRFNTNQWVVYLMHRKDRGYRVGWCQLFNSEGAFHLGQRARLEKADAAWILDVFDNKMMASATESILAAKYGIPTMMFEPNGELYNEETVSMVFGEVDSVSGAEQCLRDNARDPELPLWPYPPEREHDADGRFRGTLFKVFATNLWPDLMSIPVAGGEWAAVESTIKYDYEGDVVSLDVDDEHNYVADGLVTCNSIYEWRGARPEHMIGFCQKHNAKLLTLGTNYRSKPEIIRAANHVVLNNDSRIEKTVESNREAGGEGTVIFETAEDMDDEAARVLGHIEDLRADGLHWGDFTILYRTNAQSRAFEEVFIKAKVPYIVVGGIDYWRRKEVQDILSYLKVAETGNDAACIRAINRPFRYIGKKTIEKLQAGAAESGTSLFEFTADFWDQMDLGLNRRQIESLGFFVGIVKHVRQMFADGNNCSEVIRYVIDKTDYIDWLLKDEGSDTSENSRVSNLRELVRTTMRFDQPDELFEYLRSIEEERRKRKAKEQIDVVQLMTIHKSKGLEFPVVFLAGACEKILPHYRSANTEEERRLFYVAVTRAKNRLFVSSPVMAHMGGEAKAMEVSRFVYEAGLADRPEEAAAIAESDGNIVSLEEARHKREEGSS